MSVKLTVFLEGKREWYLTRIVAGKFKKNLYLRIRTRLPQINQPCDGISSVTSLQKSEKQCSYGSFFLFFSWLYVLTTYTPALRKLERSAGGETDSLESSLYVCGLISFQSFSL